MIEVKPGQERYFMTEASKNEAIGSATKRLSEVKLELNALHLEAMRIGKLFVHVGNILEKSPSGLTFDNESYDGQFHSEYTLSKQDQSSISVDAIRVLANDFRRLSAEKQELESRLL